MGRCAVGTRSIVDLEDAVVDSAVVVSYLDPIDRRVDIDGLGALGPNGHRSVKYVSSI